MSNKLTLPAAIALVLLTSCALAVAQDQNPLVGEVVVEGNDYVAREAILDVVKDVLKVGEEFTAVKAAEARRLVDRMGYFDEVTLSTEPMDQGVRVVITVVERQRIEQVMFAGNTVISDEELAAAILTQVGHVADEGAIGRDVGRIERYYEQQGYLARVSEAQVDDFGVLTFVIEEARLEDVVIEGLKQTKEWLVRRELGLEPGELFEQSKVTQGIRRLHRLGLFEPDGVNTELRAGRENPLRDVILVVTLTEARTGRAAFAMAYSSLDEFVVMLSAAENNLRGRAERASVSLELGGRDSYEFSFFEPYLNRRGTTLELNLFDTERRRRFVGGTVVSLSESEFDERRTGGNVTLTSPISQRRSWSVRLRSEEVSSSFFQGVRTLQRGSGLALAALGPSQATGDGSRDTPPDNPDLAPDVPEPGDLVPPVRVAAPLHPGGRVNSVVLGLIDDTRNVRTDPSSGGLSSLSFEQAGGPLGGGTQFGKLLLDHRRYHRLSAEDVLALRIMGGTTFGSPPLFESFSIGGANSLRGYELDRWRGESLALANIELRRDLNPTLTAVGFVDVGSAWGGTFRTVVPGFEIRADDQEFMPHVGAGVGLRVDTPFGPIRLDMGWGEEGSQAHFSFGHAF
ncbi:MAG: outer membrane protein assembly factor [Armatimonadota bacterium]